MENMNDQEMDNFFRSFIKDKDIPFDPASWEKLESKYDAHTSRKRRALWVPLSFLILLSVITTFFIWHLQFDRSTSTAPLRDHKVVVLPEHNKSRQKEVFVSDNNAINHSEDKQKGSKHRHKVSFHQGKSKTGFTQQGSYNGAVGSKNRLKEEKSHGADSLILSHTAVVIDSPYQKSLLDLTQNSVSRFNTSEGYIMQTPPQGHQGTMGENGNVAMESETSSKIKASGLILKNGADSDSAQKAKALWVGHAYAEDPSKKMFSAKDSLWNVVDAPALPEHQDQKLGGAYSVQESDSAAGKSSFVFKGSGKNKGRAMAEPNSRIAASEKTAKASTHYVADIQKENAAVATVIDSVRTNLGDKEQFSGDMQPSNKTRQQEGLVLRPDSELLAKNGVEKKLTKDILGDKVDLDSTIVGSRTPKLAVGIMIAPDFTGVGRITVNRLGTTVGVIGEYAILKNLSVEMGGILSYKKYASRDGYHSNKDHWQYKRMTENIKGSCYVIDIPINLKYYHQVLPTHFVVGTLGCSSYFLFDEKYTFYLPNGGGDYTYAQHETRSYLFGVVNLQLGYEKEITTKVALRAEPFLKIPITRVGTGEARLVSSGIFFLLKYRF